jgi:hypothetical protein
LTETENLESLPAHELAAEAFRLLPAVDLIEIAERASAHIATAGPPWSVVYAAVRLLALDALSERRAEARE